MTNIKKKNKNYLINILTAVIVLGITAYICYHTLHLGNVEFTNNAQIRQYVTPINSRVQGYIKEICFDEYQTVLKGDTLAIIEDMEYRLQLAQAEADYQKVIAGKSAIYTSLQTAENNILVSDANMREARVKLENTEMEFNRYEILLQKDAVTREQFEKIKTNFEVAKARYEMLTHQKQSVSLIKDEHYHQVNQYDALLNLAKASLELARLNLSYTIITAPGNGVTGRKNIQAGQLIEPGQTLVDMVNRKDIWITANYKESQIAHIEQGMSVEIKVDAYPDRPFKGVVKSISDATGASFSLIPQDNSTGNFVKVQQRIPVRIEFSDENEQEQLNRLRAGMNVECLIKY